MARWMASSIWMFTLLAVSPAAATETPPGKIMDGTAYGAPALLSGVYFTNFENSIFTECASEADCRDWPTKEGAWVHCDARPCADLESRIRALNGNHDRSGSFVIRFVGRRALAKHPKRFLNDREDSVLVERILDMRLLETAHMGK